MPTKADCPCLMHPVEHGAATERTFVPDNDLRSSAAPLHLLRLTQVEIYEKFACNRLTSSPRCGTDNEEVGS
jgi:hypothetical protein